MEISDIERAKNGIEAVARFMETEFGTESRFHLRACGGCGAPAFHQPCSICNYYPMGADKGTWSPVTAGPEDFQRSIERSGPGGKGGNLATWFLDSMRTLVGFSSPAGKARLDDVLGRAVEVQSPDAELYWDVVVEQGQALHRETPEPWIVMGWHAAFEIGNLVKDAGVPHMNASWRAVREDWVSAVHSGEDEAVLSSIKALIKIGNEISDIYPRNGNLHAARGELRKAEELLWPHLEAKRSASAGMR